MGILTPQCDWFEANQWDGWLHRLDLERRNGHITLHYATVGREIAHCIMRGEAEPSEAALADKVGCHVRTVQRAKRRLRALGLLDWQRQQERDERGRLKRERPCAYRITAPTLPLRARQRGARKEETTGKRLESRSVAAQIAALPAPTRALEAIRAERRRRLALI